MSSWGNLDNVIITGNVSTTANSTLVTNAAGNATVFLSEIKDGDYIIIAGLKYQVRNVTSNVVLTLTNNAATSANAIAFIQQGPKYVSNVLPYSGRPGRESNVYTIQNVFGVDKNEAVVTENRNRNLKVPGWNHYVTYTDANGVRHKGEALVAMSKNFNANATGVLQTDASDDAVLADFEIVILTQPADASDAAGNAVTFFVAADSSPVAGEVLTYQWFEDNTSGTFAVVNDGGDYTGNTTNTLTIGNVSNVDGYLYRVVISGNGGADSVTSNTAEATEA